MYGYVERWNDAFGLGTIFDQERTQEYVVMRPDIFRDHWNYKTLQELEFVEFFASDLIDQKTGLPIAKMVTGPDGLEVLGSYAYRARMLKSGNFPKPGQDEGQWAYPRNRVFWQKLSGQAGVSARPWYTRKFNNALKV